MEELHATEQLRLGVPGGATSALILIALAVLLAVLGIREQLALSDPRRRWLLHGLRIASLTVARLYVIPDGFPRALSVGRSAGSASIAVSTGLLGSPSPAELEGVIAHEVAHIRNRDVVIQTTVVVLAASLVEFSRIGGWLSRALLYVLGPLAASFTHLLLTPRREFEADRLAAQLCESPHGLADTLVRLEQASELVSFEASPATEPLYTITTRSTYAFTVTLANAAVCGTL